MKIFQVLIFVLFQSLCLGAFGRELIVIVKDYVEVVGRQVYLADLVKNPGQLSTILREIDSVPLPVKPTVDNREAWLSSHRLKIWLQVRLNTKLQVHGPKFIHIKFANQTVADSDKQLSAEAERIIKSQLEPFVSDLSVKCEMSFSVAKEDEKSAQTLSHVNSRISEVMKFRVVIDDENLQKTAIDAECHVTGKKMIPYAVRNLNKSEHVNAADIIWESKPIAEAGEAWPKSLKEVFPVLRAKLYIKKNTPLNLSQFERIPVFLKDERKEILVCNHNKTICVERSVILKQDAHPESVIFAQDVSENKLLKVRVGKNYQLEFLD